MGFLLVQHLEPELDSALAQLLSPSTSQWPETIKAEGGITIAQDEFARYNSMPRSAVAAGAVD